MILPKSLTEVTPFSKAVAMVLFVSLPFIGFYLGYNYHKSISVISDYPDYSTKSVVREKTLSATPQPSLDLVDTSNWKLYTSPNFGYSFKYPKSFKISKFVILSEASSLEELSIQSPDIVNDSCEDGNHCRPPKGLDLWLRLSKRACERENISGVVYYFKISNPGIGCITITRNGGDDFYPSWRNIMATVYSTLKIAPTSQVKKDLSTQELTYNLPNNWRTIKDTSHSFEIGYDPANFVARASNKSILLANLSHSDFNTVQLIEYAGDSLHQAIYDRLGYDATAASLEKKPKNFEKSYSYNGGRCLVLYGLTFIPSGDTWGICTIGNQKAIFFRGLESEDQTVELFRTFRYVIEK